MSDAQLIAERIDLLHNTIVTLIFYVQVTAVGVFACATALFINLGLNVTRKG